jgi:hypothetical protein
MTNKNIDKLMKPYWDEKFNDAYLGEHRKELSGWEDAWDGVIMKRPDGSEILIVGYPVPDDNPNTWFYDGNVFTNGEKLFNIGIGEFNKSMVRYINEKYNLKVKSVL